MLRLSWAMTGRSFGLTFRVSFRLPEGGVVDLLGLTIETKSAEEIFAGCLAIFSFSTMFGIILGGFGGIRSSKFRGNRTVSIDRWMFPSFSRVLIFSRFFRLIFLVLIFSFGRDTVVVSRILLGEERREVERPLSFSAEDAEGEEARASFEEFSAFKVSSNAGVGSKGFPA